MNSERATRRQCLGALGVTLASALAGCGAVLDGVGGTQSDTQTTQDNPTTNSSVPADANAYTEVYHNTVGSVVGVIVSAGGGTRTGSGFVYKSNKLITNAQRIEVRFSKGEWREATRVGIDPSSDLAVLSVDNSPQYAKPLTLQKKDPAIGTRVIAIGNPYGLEGSLTNGLVSGVNRSTRAPNGYTIPDAIQTSAPVNPGNSAS